MVHSFEPLIPNLQGLRTGLLARVHHGAKRKRANSDSFDSEDDIVSSAESSDSRNTSLDGEDTEEAEENLIKHQDFPHAPLVKVSKFSKRSKYTGTPHRNLKVQHLHVLCAIINKCLQDEDFARARRAFSILLRLNTKAGLVDLRRCGLWGFGAELLLQQSTGSSRDKTTPNIHANHSPLLSKRILQVVRNYYERLILQYPYQKFRPKALNAQDFYPAMLGLWVVHAHYRTSTMINKLSLDAQDELTSSRTVQGSDSESEDESQSGLSEADGTESNEIALLNSKSRSGESLIRRARRAEISQAKAVARRMDEIMFLPPYDQDVKLLRLRGNVSLWIADLTLAIGGPMDEARKLRKMAIEHFKKARVSGEVAADNDNDNYSDDDGDGGGSGGGDYDNVVEVNSRIGWSS